MKKTLLLILVTIGLIGSARSASLISTSNVLFTTNSDYETENYSFEVTLQDGGQRGYFYLSNNPSSSVATISLESVTLGYPANWYLMSYGDVLDGSKPSFNGTPNSLETYLDSRSPNNSLGYKDISIDSYYNYFYLGFAASYGYNISSPFVEYGWIELNYNPYNSTISMVQNVTSYGGGIVIGTQSVPEPSTYALFGIGAIGMLIVMRRKKTA
jgi:hypothetical protein